MINPERPNYSNTPASLQRAVYPYGAVDLGGSPVVSIITAYYNTDESFLETARSILNQSLQSWEWVIVDDGSTDPDALVRLRSVGANEPRIHVITQANVGPAAARNRAFRESIGRYICLLDSDDMIEPTFMEKCVWFLESNNEFAFCNAWSVTFGDEEYLWQIGFERGKAHLTDNSGPPISVIRRSAFVASGGFDESIRLGHEDWDFWLAMANAGQWGYTLPEYLEWYRRRKSGRFFEVMNSAGAHRQFERMLAQKYEGLEQRFPSPQRKRPDAFETVSSELPFYNRHTKAKGDQRILFVLPWMVTGGADRINLDWITILQSNGHQVSVCATLEAHHNWWHEFTKVTPDVFILPNFLRPVDFPRFLLYLIGSRQIDIVLVTGSTLGYQSLPFLRRSCPDVTFLDLCHVEEPHWWNGGHPRFGVGYQEMLDLNLVTTGHLREWMAGRGGDRDRIEVCHPGIDLRGFAQSVAARVDTRSTLRIAEQVPTITFAGRICDQKRPLFFAEILRALSERNIGFQALVIGDGELRATLAKRIDAYGLKAAVRLLGTLEHERWIDVLAASDIFLLPSQYEGVSVALLEAMALGVVPVVSAVGGQAEVVSVETGFLIPQGDGEIDAYVTALADLVANPDRRLAMGRAAGERIHRHYSRNATAIRLLSLLEHARALSVSAPRRPPGPGLARELATLAVEYARLTHVANSLWIHHLQHEAAFPSSDTALPLNGIAILLTRLGSTRMGSAVLRSKTLRKLGQWVLKRLDARQHQAP